MKTKDSWTSLYRKEKFYENRNQKKEKLETYDLLGRESSKKTKQIAVMLDIEKTSEDITDELAEIFINQLNFIRLKFNADIGVICLSTHYRDAKKMQPILEIFSRHTTSKIKLGYHFYLGGIYDYNKKEERPQEYDFNSQRFNRNKIETFSLFYIEDYETITKWFAVIDDNISEESYKKYQENSPCVYLRPSKEEEDLKYNNFMNLATTTYGFQGVLEMFQVYIESIKMLNESQILNKQMDMMTHLSSLELCLALRNQRFDYVERYFKEGYADKDDYQTTLKELEFLRKEIVFERKDWIHIKTILTIIEEYYINKEEQQKLSRVKNLQNTFLTEVDRKSKN